MPFPSNALEDNDDSLELILSTIAGLALIGLYHRHLRNEGFNGVDEEEEEDEDEDEDEADDRVLGTGDRPGVRQSRARRRRKKRTTPSQQSFDTLNENVQVGRRGQDTDGVGVGDARVDDAGEEGRNLANGGPETVTSEAGKDKPRRTNYWTQIAPFDLCFGAKPEAVSRRLLGLFRFFGVVYCGCFWIEYWRTKGCCEDFEYAQAWHLIMLSAMFLLGLGASLKSNSTIESAQYGLDMWECAFVIAVEIEAPTCFLMFFLHWKYFCHAEGAASSMFPSGEQLWLNGLFVSMNVAWVVLELSLNRLVLSSRRWMYFSYLYLIYLFYMICIEKLRGDGKLLYKKQGFLKLSTTSFPELIELWMIYFCCHYLAVAISWAKQKLLMRPVEFIAPSPSISETIGDNVISSQMQFNEPLLQSRDQHGQDQVERLNQPLE